MGFILRVTKPLNVPLILILLYMTNYVRPQLDFTLIILNSRYQTYIDRIKNTKKAQNICHIV